MNKSILILGLVIVALFAALPFATLSIAQRNTNELKSTVYTRCLDSNKSRIEGNKRGAILVEFLSTAATAREKAALNGTVEQQKDVDAKTARRYRALADKVTPYPLLVCKKP